MVLRSVELTVAWDDGRWHRWGLARIVPFKTRETLLFVNYRRGRSHRHDLSFGTCPFQIDNAKVPIVLIFVKVRTLTTLAVNSLLALVAGVHDVSRLDMIVCPYLQIPLRC